ncbi:MAG: SIMPL domain-containing protein [Candidatus Micrarchaeota archaeon]
MAKEDEMTVSGGKGQMLVIAAVLLTVGMLGSAYMLSQVDYSPKVNVTGGPSSPNVYVSSTPPEHAISVSASASTKVAPDLLNIQLRVQTESTVAKTAQEDNAEVAADLRSKLEGLGVKAEDIQTTSYSVDPVYDSDYVCEQGGIRCHYESTLKGYRVTHGISVKLTELDKGGDVIDAAGTAGTNQTFVDYVQFTLKDETRRSIEKSLLQNASAEAKSKAQGIASGLGVSVGKVLSASESFSYPVYYKSYDFMAGAMEAAPSVPTQLSPGQVDVSATVSTSFEVGG